jgi:SulP family sulfate permease
MAGILLIIMGVLKLGSLIRFIPETITVGFTAGIAVTIFLGQIKDFLGITYQNFERPIEAIEKVEANINNISTVSVQAVIIGVISLAILILYPKLEKKIPPSLIAVVIGAVLVGCIPFINNGVYTIGELYDIPSGFPRFTLGSVDLSVERIIALVPYAVTIAVLAGIESLLSCVVADGMINAKHNPNAELTAQGLANISSVMFGGIPATGAIARTAANIKNGGRTPIAGMVHSVVLLLVLLVLMPYAKLIPMPTIAAILFIVAYNMSEWRKFVHIIKTEKFYDSAIMIITFALTVIFDLVVAIAVGMALVIVKNIILKIVFKTHKQ